MNVHGQAAAPNVGTAAPLLELRSVSKAFPGVKALDDVTFTLLPGEIHALMGENGAGKSTLIKIMSGVYRADSGEVLLDGVAVDVADPVMAQALGLSYVPQEIGVEPFMTVAENMFLGRFPRRRFGALDHRAMRDGAARILRDLGMDLDPDSLAGTLSIAEKQMITIGRAISTDCKLIIFDEATSSLTGSETRRLFGVIKGLQARGMAMIFVTHRMDELFELCDRVTILRDGRHISTSALTDMTMEKVIKDMVGRQIEVHAPASLGHSGRALLEVEGLSVDGVLRGIDLTVHSGEIVGLAGLMGSGRTELARAIFGDLKISSGTIRVAGREMDKHSPQAAIDAGLALVPEDRKAEGLVLTHSVKANISGAVLRSLSHWGTLVGRQETTLARKYVDQLSIRTPTIDQEVRLLSGGNQQRVVIAKWLATHPKVLIVDEPTRGIDIGAKSEIHALLADLAARGMAILVISSELLEVIALSERVLVMYRGSIQGELSGSNVTQEQIMRLATGTEMEVTHAAG